MKSFYSFDAFGKQKHGRNPQLPEKSPFRNTMQFDTPYYRDKADVANVGHALVDPSHTFHPNRYTKKRRNFKVYSFKKSEPNTERLTAKRRVTYNIDGKPIIRLCDQVNDHPSMKEFTPMDDYRMTQKTNRDLFSKLN